MGSAFDSWTDVTGAYFMGADTGWKAVWLVVSIVLLVAALYVGSRHELDAYTKAEDNNK